MQYATVCRPRSSHLKSFSCSETPQNDSGLATPQDETLTKLCNDVAARIEARIKQQRQSLNEQRYCQPRLGKTDFRECRQQKGTTTIKVSLLSELMLLLTKVMKQQSKL